MRMPTEAERAVLNKLIEPTFSGKAELARLLSSIEVDTLDPNGSLRIQSLVSGIAPTVKTIPVEAEALDSDGTPVYVLLHMREGRPTELEIFRGDGNKVLGFPKPASMQVHVLAP